MNYIGELNADENKPMNGNGGTHANVTHEYEPQFLCRLLRTNVGLGKQYSRPISGK